MEGLIVTTALKEKSASHKAHASKFDLATRLIGAHDNVDLKAVERLLREADSEGDSRATFALASWYLNGTPHTRKNLKLGTSLLMKAARLENPEALLNLGWAYETGTGVKPNLQQAFRLYLQSALSDNAEAMYQVSRMFAHGLGTERDLKLARMFLKKATEADAPSTRSSRSKTPDKRSA